MSTNLKNLKQGFKYLLNTIVDYETYVKHLVPLSMPFVLKMPDVIASSLAHAMLDSWAFLSSKYQPKKEKEVDLMCKELLKNLEEAKSCMDIDELICKAASQKFADNAVKSVKQTHIKN